jgi:tRNA threonylcarbamoyl adenosine modification protein (Sua5/YciO/YrdC/YwlC family)
LPESSAITEACQVLSNGLLVVAPSETRYGLLADPLNPDSMKRILDVKGRDRSKPMALFVENMEQVKQVARVTPLVRVLAKRFLPGPLTLVAPACCDWPAPLVVEGKIGLRISPSLCILEILRELGRPVSATSANRSGEPEAGTIDEIESHLGDEVALYLDAGQLDNPVSTVVDCSGDRPVILRTGAVSEADVMEAARQELKP